MKKNIRGNTVVFYWSSWKKTSGVTLSFFIGRHEKKHKGNNRNAHIHFNVMYILFVDDWLLCIVIASVVQWSALSLTPWKPGFKSGWCPLLEVSYFYFHALMRNYKVKYNHCDDYIRCLDGASISSEVNTLNSSGSDPRKNVDRGTTVVFYWSTWKKHER